MKKTDIKNFLNCKSRFFFNINFAYIIKKILSLFFTSSEKIDNLISVNIKKYYPNSKNYMFNHGRSGLYFLLKNLKQKTKKKKVIINSFTLFEMVNMIIYAGFEPIFADNKSNSFETDIQEILKNRNDIAAVILTHLNGYNKDITKVKQHVSKYNQDVIIIEDCAVSFGAKVNERYVGSDGDYTILSFNMMKNITTIVGGALIENENKHLLNNEENYKKIKTASTSSFLKKIIFFNILLILNSRIVFPFFFIFLKFAHNNNLKFFLKKYRTDFELNLHKKIPEDYNLKMNLLQKLLLISQFKDLEVNINKRIHNAKLIYNRLKNKKYISFPQKEFNRQNIFIDFPIIVDDYSQKKALWLKSLSRFIDIKNYYYSNCGNNKIYEKFENYSLCNNAENLSKNIFMLPVNQRIGIDQIYKITNLFINE